MIDEVYPLRGGRDGTSRSQSNSTENNPLSQFLTPEAMLTPGVAGSLTMMITNALAVNFAMPRAWVGLGLSFVFGLLVLVTARNLLQKAVFYVLNSLVIFCVAVGANGIGTGTAQRVSLSLTTTAFAEDASSDAAKKQQTLEYCSNLSPFRIGSRRPSFEIFFESTSNSWLKSLGSLVLPIEPF